MSTGEAIQRLRKQLDISQEDFAKLLLTSTRTLSRCETGMQQPSNAVLLMLESLAVHRACSKSLGDLFKAARLSNIAARGEALSSPGAAPRVSQQELSRWALVAKEINRKAASIDLALANEQMQKEETRKVLSKIMYLALEIEEQICPYVAEGTKLTAHSYIESQNPERETARARSEAVEVNKRNQEFWERRSK